MFKSFAISAKNIEEAKNKLEKELSVFFRCNGAEIIGSYKNIETFREPNTKDCRPEEFMKWAEEITANI